MNTTYTWLNGLVGQLVEGAADGFLAVAGGSSLASAALKAPAATLEQILISMALLAAIYAASFLKSNPTPFTTVTSLAAKDVTVPTSESPPKVVPQSPTLPPVLPVETPHV